jgi:hypothetical protein
VDTFGWDTVSVLAADTVNGALAGHAGELVMAFDADPGTDPPVTARGVFASWQIMPGGTEQLLYLGLAVESGTLSVGVGSGPRIAVEFVSRMRESDASTHDLAGVTVVVAINLRVLHNSGEEKATLRFDLTRPGYTLPPAGPGCVTPVTVIDPGGKLSVAAKSLLGMAIADDLVRKSDRVHYIFSTISLVPPGTDSWLAPTVSDYSYGARESGGRPFLGVLNMTEGRPATGHPRQIDPTALREDMSASFVISRDLFLRRVLLPALPTAYRTGADSFVFDADRHMIRNTREFEAFSVRSGLIDYHPRIVSFELRVEGDSLRSSVAGTCDMYAGIGMSFTINSVNRAVFDPATRRLAFATDPNPRSSHTSDVPWYFWFLGPLVVGITELCVKVISDSIAQQLTDLLRGALSITESAPKIVTWTDTDGFDVHVAGLDGALYIMGQVRPRTTALT